MLRIGDSIVKPTMFGLTVIFIAGMSQVMAQAPRMNDKSLQETATQRADPVQKLVSATTSLPDICKTSVGEAQPSVHGPHSVKLSWNASVPLTTSRNDEISCYLVYRSASPPDKNATLIGIALAPETTYIDLHVESGSYYYAVRAVNVGGSKSDFSKDVSVQVAH
jgi:hypothetical protein